MDRMPLGEGWRMDVWLVFVGVCSLWVVVGVCHCCCGGLTISFTPRTAAFGLHSGDVDQYGRLVA